MKQRKCKKVQEVPINIFSKVVLKEASENCALINRKKKKWRKGKI